ncbi:hypothetical protein SLEP1_g43175 [Rubroshorea leprosula]|uniref:Uncharacterized protein n=1 Tax=Rubroshorea leprosula TaxID=152421 RepID=A0AAV5LCG1_9ROSI|nr:hypothetical protein SLEP1_g43175 [Rubroshorea leprosula]
MANNPQEQPSHTESVAVMAGTKSFDPKKPPPSNLVSLFQTKDLQNEIKQVLQHHKTSHSDQMFVLHMNSQILGPYFISPPPLSLKFLYPQSKEHLLPFQVKPDWSKWVGHFGTWPAWRR